MVMKLKWETVDPNKLKLNYFLLQKEINWLTQMQKSFDLKLKTAQILQNVGTFVHGLSILKDTVVWPPTQTLQVAPLDFPSPKRKWGWVGMRAGCVGPLWHALAPLGYTHITALAGLHSPLYFYNQINTCLQTIQ